LKINVCLKNSCHYDEFISKLFYIFSKERKILKSKVKGKAIHFQAWTGPEGSRRLRLPDIKTIGK
jgi:hypothetical protein